ncbi:hypothetical protein R6Q57_026225 [Mikania cordata]
MIIKIVPSDLKMDPFGLKLLIMITSICSFKKPKKIKDSAHQKYRMQCQNPELVFQFVPFFRNHEEVMVFNMKLWETMHRKMNLPLQS